MSTATRSASASASPRSWVTSTVVMRSSRRTAPRSPRSAVARRLIEARERLVEQQHARARARARAPARPAAPRRPTASRAARSASAATPKRSSQRVARAARRRAAGTPRKRSPRATLSATVVSASSGSWKTLAMRRRSASAPAPASTGRPASEHAGRGRAGSSRPSTRSSVDLPLPLGPMTASTSPAATSSAGTSSASAPRTSSADVAQREDGASRHEAARGSSRGGSRTPSGGRGRSRGSRRRGAAPRPRGRSRPARARRARRAGCAGSTWCRSPRRATTMPRMRFMWCRGSAGPAVLADEPHVLGPDEEGDRRVRRRQVRAGRRVHRLQQSGRASGAGCGRASPSARCRAARCGCP